MPDLATLLPMVALLMAIGAFAGVIAGLLGVGGGIVLVPAFFYAFSHLGYGGPELMRVCLATSLATIILTSARSVMAHSKKGAVEWEVLRRWWPYIGSGAVIGMFVVSSLRSTTLQIIFGVLALGAGLYMALGKSHWRLGQTMPVGRKRAGVGTVIGFFSVLMGIGGGSFGVPLMTLYNIPIHRAVATAAGFGIIIAVPSVVGFLFVHIENAPPFSFGAVNLPAFGMVIAMTLLTAPIGAGLAHKMNPAPLKRVFAVFITLVALNMLRKVMMG
ncbi:sulfite exporter TauE/SafE family protein [Pseudorhodobacter aquimaris]|uniref:sulfite exporter TauE/SafE family protein n=1 Tax=Pseudorhodobacter aquimaris TaxID=687412 RepID=UPI00067D4998|nr:sulfite exporter TauE/SafE family protein [Pseudorhodobacter aquimaris]